MRLTNNLQIYNNADDIFFQAPTIIHSQRDDIKNNNTNMEVKMSNKGKPFGAKVIVTDYKGKRLSSRFGPRIHPVTGEKGKMHNGIDIAVPIGTPIVSPYDGVVTFSGDQGSGGLAIIIRCDDIMLGFCHLSKLNYIVGDTIKAGDVLALSGNTGRSSGPHVHASVREKQGNDQFSLVNPEPYYKNEFKD